MINNHLYSDFSMKKILIAIIILGVACYLWYVHAISPVDAGNESRVKVKIESGWSTETIANELKSQGVIRSPLAFRLYVQVHRLEKTLQAGVYLLHTSFSNAEIVQMLRTGRGEEISVTIPEGYTVRDIDTLLKDLGLITEGEAITCASHCDFSSYDFVPTSTDGLAARGGKLEGYLFPDTYYVSPNDFVVKFFFERMLNAFRKAVIEGHAEDIEASGRSVAELVNMASLIEKETRTDDERSVVADILWKRYDDSRGLGVDATVRYILDKPVDEITQADLNSNSQYNTRKFRGLPPGPIANPGIKSILAALHPEKSPYWYYLHDLQGQIHYAASNEEHNLNRIKYLQGGIDGGS